MTQRFAPQVTTLRCVTQVTYARVTSSFMVVLKIQRHSQFGIMLEFLLSFVLLPSFVSFFSPSLSLSSLPPFLPSSLPSLPFLPSNFIRYFSSILHSYHPSLESYFVLSSFRLIFLPSSLPLPLFYTFFPPHSLSSFPLSFLPLFLSSFIKFFHPPFLHILAPSLCFCFLPFFLLYIPICLVFTFSVFPYFLSFLVSLYSSVFFLIFEKESI